MKAIAEMKSDTEQTMKLDELYKVGSECDLNLWPDRPVGWNSVVVASNFTQANFL